MSKYFRFEKNGKWGIKDDQDNIILESIYDYINLGWNNKAIIKVWLDKKCGLLDVQGKVILEPIYDYMWLSAIDEDDFIFVSIEKKWGLFDYNGNKLLPMIFDSDVDLIELHKRLKLKEKLLK